MFVPEPRHLHVPPGRAARGGRDAVRRAGAVHQPLVPAQLRGRDRRGGPPPAHHHLRQAPHRQGGGGTHDACTKGGFIITRLPVRLDRNAVLVESGILYRFIMEHTRVRPI